MFRVIVILVCLLVFPLAVRAQSAEPKAAEPRTDVRRLLHIELASDLDSTRMARDLGGALTKARADNTEMIILEVAGRKCRADVLREVARTLTAEPRLPLVVYLNPADGQAIGLGQAWLALLADPGCAFADPAARFECGAGDDLEHLTPAEFESAIVHEDLRALAAGALTRRAGPILLTALCPRPTGPLWTVSTGEGDDGLKILAEEPTASEVSKVLATPDPRHEGTFRAAFTADTARRIGLIVATARGPGDMLSQRRVNVWKTDRVRITSGLAASRGTVERALKAIDSDRASVKAALDATRDKVRSKNATLLEQAKTVARRQMTALDDLESRIGQAEAVTADYPELLRSPPPGATTLAASAAETASDWRDAFQSRRTGIASLRTRAQTILATPAP